jgi:hypothetical protein
MIRRALPAFTLRRPYFFREQPPELPCRYRCLKLRKVVTLASHPGG